MHRSQLTKGGLKQLHDVKLSHKATKVFDLLLYKQEGLEVVN